MGEYCDSCNYPKPEPRPEPEKKFECLACVEKVHFDLPKGGKKDEEALWIKNEMVIKQTVEFGKKEKEEFFIEEKLPWALLIIRLEDKKKPGPYCV